MRNVLTRLAAAARDLGERAARAAVTSFGSSLAAITAAAVTGDISTARLLLSAAAGAAVGAAGEVILGTIGANRGITGSASLDPTNQGPVR
ncbi:flagellar protein [Parafrankia soli]|uniref:Flagellar protein n=1 Tax=Parafrankia soli TaxID=2599596 RepID=A0A1S1RMG7_9ACTN|nr:flagellar protein [Parafrankia soli]OHV46595.1 flagellar protein [Parafrankia soli]